MTALGYSQSVYAEIASPSVVISQFKITSSNGQFITLYNSSGSTLDMTKLQIKYYNNFDPAKSTSNRTLKLHGTLSSGGYYIVSDDLHDICYRVTIYSMSLGLASTSGYIEITYVDPLDTMPVVQDYVAWSKKSQAGAQTLSTNLEASYLRRPTNPQFNPDISTPGSGNWLTVIPDPNNSCQLISDTSAQTTISTSSIVASNFNSPPIVVDNQSIALSTDSSLPDYVVNLGLINPSITELLPNPAGTGNDSTDEFVEIYNPNSSNFDLGGFVIQVGTAVHHNYTFPAGTIINGQKYVAYFSSLSGLALSNSGGQARLIDQTGQIVSETGTYSLAKDGMSWNLNNGLWAWSTSPTPNTANVLVLEPAKRSTTKSTNSSKSSISSKISGSDKAQPKPTTLTMPAKPVTSPIHIWTLAMVGGVAILYLAYEYRTDLANQLHKFRRYFKDRRSLGTTFAWRRGD